MEIGFQTHLLAEAKIGVKARKIGLKIPTIIIIIIFFSFAMMECQFEQYFLQSEISAFYAFTWLY